MCKHLYSPPCLLDPTAISIIQFWPHVSQLCGQWRKPGCLGYARDDTEKILKVLSISYMDHVLQIASWLCRLTCRVKRGPSLIGILRPLPTIEFNWPSRWAHRFHQTHEADGGGSDFDFPGNVFGASRPSLVDDLCSYTHWKLKIMYMANRPPKVG